MAGSDVGRNENCSHLSDRPLNATGLPLARIYLLTPRPSMPAAAVIARGELPGGGRMDFAWLVFNHGHSGPPVVAPPATGREWLNNSVITDVSENLVKIVFETPTVTSSVPSGSRADAIADHRKTVARWSRKESFALVAYRNATKRVLNAKHRMIALNAKTYANLLETGNGRPGADRPYKGGHHGRHQI